MSGIHQRIAEDAGLAGRRTVTCTECGATLVVDGGYCLAHGWPKCCGYTMMLEGDE